VRLFRNPFLDSELTTELFLLQGYREDAAKDEGGADETKES
jgi:hypothetical protein